jgi:2-keto-4-pentenoate hydratase/2-oxohepta-3-ene-1,7-dioic acid hydratase in catechol pathway
MAQHRIATYSVDGKTGYGAVVDGGIVDLSGRFAKQYPTLREAIAAGALMKLAEDAARRAPDHALKTITWLLPIPSPEKVICIGVNYPDRNAEYKDGTDAPKYPSMFMRTPRSFVGHDTPLVRPRASTQLDYEGGVALVIGKAGRHIPESAALDHIATFTTLVPGDVILTGTPTGAGARFDPPRYLKPGDVVEIEADGIGVLRNGVIDEVL